MPRPVVAALRTVLVAVLLALVLVQTVVLPGAAEDSARRFPEAAFLQAPVLVLAVGTVACVQVVLACVSWLLGEARPGRIVDAAACRCADVLVGATATATALVLATGVVVSATVGSPAWAAGLLVAVVGAGLTGCALVLRRRLRLAVHRHVGPAELL